MVWKWGLRELSVVDFDDSKSMVQCLWNSEVWVLLSAELERIKSEGGEEAASP
jgi:hypothetical protein